MTCHHQGPEGMPCSHAKACPHYVVMLERIVVGIAEGDNRKVSPGYSARIVTLHEEAYQYLQRVAVEAKRLVC